MNREEYLTDPCRASSLPFWKTEQIAVPDQLSIVREDQMPAAPRDGTAEPYFKLCRRLERLPGPCLPDSFELSRCEFADYAAHIAACYVREGVTAKELAVCARRPVYDPSLWIAVRDQSSRRIVASCISDLDARIVEGILECIQVSPDYRGRGLGRFIVCELLRRMQGKAAFATVSGRLDSPGALALYLSCGFENRVIWYVVTRP